MYKSLRYPLAVELDGEWIGDFTIALCGLRWQDSEPWLEGRPLPLNALIESNASIVGNELGLIEAALGALRAWPRRSRTRAI